MIISPSTGEVKDDENSFTLTTSRRKNVIYLTLYRHLPFFFLLSLWGPSAYVSGSSSAL
jgi:hypothetical protein